MILIHKTSKLTFMVGVVGDILFILVDWNN